MTIALISTQIVHYGYMASSTKTLPCIVQIIRNGHGSLQNTVRRHHQEGATLFNSMKEWINSDGKNEFITA